MKSKISDSKMLESLLRKEDIALAMLYEAYANDLFVYFLNKYPIFRNDSSELTDLITDSLFELVKAPEKYNLNKSSLKSFIIRDIRGNLINFISKKDNKKNSLVKAVELDINVGNIEMEEVNYQKLGTEIKNFFARVFASEQDQLLAWMIKVDKIRQTKNFRPVLDIGDRDQLSIEEIVKRHKDRINAKLKRNGYEEFLKQLQKNV